MKHHAVHLHAEQFDGRLHAACGKLGGLRAPDDRIVGEEAFSAVSPIRRCYYCSKINWPYGGAR